MHSRAVFERHTARSCAPHYRHNSSAPCRHAARAAPHGRRRARTVAVHAERSFYDILGVPADANERDIKRAYRQKALKLHPDVNKAPDAQQRFMEVKTAFSVLSDPQQRAEYDGRQRAGSWGSWRPSGSSTGGSGFGGYGSSWGTGSGGYGASGGRTKPQQEEEFYGLGDLFGAVGKDLADLLSGAGREVSNLQQGLGSASASAADWLQQQTDGLSSVPGSVAGWAKERAQHIRADRLEDFFRDLEKEAESWAKKRSEARKGSGKEDSPLSLWEELAAIGEEFVEYLESALPEEEEKARGRSAASSAGASSSGGSRPRSPVDEYEELKKRYGMDEGSSGSGAQAAGSSSTGSRGPPQQQQQQRAPPPPPPPKAKTADEEVDEMLAALKKKLGKI